MTYSDIYKKFLIEYDKDATTSSYPSLTITEIANILDKAYLAIIAQKLTGTNTRGVGFEGDIKAIEDIRPLLTTTTCTRITSTSLLPDYISANERVFGYPDSDVLYYVQSYIVAKSGSTEKQWPTLLVSHSDANAFKETAHNHPWIEYPTVYLEGSNIHVLYGLDDFTDDMMNGSSLHLTYITKPVLFTEDTTGWATTQWQLSDTMAEEVINLAIIMSLETIESARLSTKMSTSKLES